LAYNPLLSSCIRYYTNIVWFYELVEGMCVMKSKYQYQA